MAMDADQPSNKHARLGDGGIASDQGSGAGAAAPSALAVGMSLVDLPPELLSRCTGFVGKGHHRFVAGSCKALRAAQLAAFPGDGGKITNGKSIASSLHTVQMWEEEARVDAEGAVMVGCAAAAAGKLDVLKYSRARARNLSGEWISCAITGEKRGCGLSPLAREKWRECNYTFDLSCISHACNNEQWRVAKGVLVKWVLERNTFGPPALALSLSLAPMGKSRDSVELVKWCIKRSCPMGGVAIEAAGSGNVAVLQTIHERGDKTAYLDQEVKFKMMERALEDGMIDTLEWAKGHGYTQLQDMPFKPVSWQITTLFKSACTNGHIDSIKWLRSQGYEWNEWTCSGAAFHGHLELLKWLRANGCPWDDQTLAWAHHNGHEEIVQWAVQNGCPTWEGEEEEDFW